MRYGRLLLLLCVCFVMLTVFASATTTNYKLFNSNKVADDIEIMVNQKSVINVAAVNNSVSIDGDKVREKHIEAADEMKKTVEKITKMGMVLNREVKNTVTVQVSDMDLSDFAEIVIDEENLRKMLTINELKIVLRDENEYISITGTAFKYIVHQYRDFRIQIKKLSDTYTVRFLDAKNNIIEKYISEIKFAIPASHAEQTVYLFSGNTQENWGGQYNENIKAIEFMSKYSGEYTVASPTITLNDIDGLTDYEKQVIRFMIVRGYFKSDDNKFNPSEKLTRYDFAESLVRMFFAIDNETMCTFPDVNDEYYRYVAVSQQDNIVLGFEDGKFRGNENVTVEQVVALISRTINQKKGYLYPENPRKYLNFNRVNYIEEWAEKEVALAIREGVYSEDMDLTFADDISRKDAAVMLYRLFMIINNTPDTDNVIQYITDTKIVRTSPWTLKNVIIVGCSAVVLNAAAITVLAVLRSKKKKKI